MTTLSSDERTVTRLAPMRTRTDSQLAELMSIVNNVVNTLNNAFPTVAAEFKRKYSAWEESWQGPDVVFSSSSADLAVGREWDGLVAMGPKILPQVVSKLKSSRHVFAVELYNRLQTDPTKKVSKDDIVCSPHPNLHAAKIIEHYAAHVLAVRVQVSALKAHQWANMCFSHSRYFIDHESFRTIVAMGKDQVYPLVMAEYAKDKYGWWHEMLYQLEHYAPSNAGRFNKAELYEEWKAKFEAPSS